MSDDMLERAKNRRERLIKALADVEAFIATYQELAAEAAAVSGTLKSKPERSNLRSPRMHGYAPETDTARTVSLAISQIQELKRPVPLGDLYRHLSEQGFKIPGKDPRNTLGARLSNAVKKGAAIVSLKNYGWWLSDQPYAPAGYKPGISATSQKSLSNGGLWHSA